MVAGETLAHLAKRTSFANILPSQIPCRFTKVAIIILLLLSSFTTLGTGRCTQEAEPVRSYIL